MKDINKNNEKEQLVRTPAEAEQILIQEQETVGTSIADAAGTPAAAPTGRGGNNKRRPQRPQPAKRNTGLTDSGMIEKVVSINRVSKTNKGGTRISFSALVVIGDAKGKVGYGIGKAAEVATAIKKGLSQAKKQMIVVARRGTTITHEILGSCGASQVLLKPASEGTGVIASGAVRAVCDGAGISNILTKCHRSNNPINVVKATFDGLSRLKTVKEV